MFEAVSKYLDLLKASGWQTGMLALFAGLFLFFSHRGILPPLDAWVTIGAWIVLFACGALAAASLGTAIQNGVHRLWKMWQRRKAIERIEQAFVDDIPFLSEKDRQILGYLREKRQKTLIADIDGGYGSTLIAKQYIYMMGVAGQRYPHDRVPFAVAEHVWKIVNERPEDFPYKPEFSPEDRRVEMHPWRIPWMLR